MFYYMFVSMVLFYMSCIPCLLSTRSSLFCRSIRCSWRATFWPALVKPHKTNQRVVLSRPHNGAKASLVGSLTPISAHHRLTAQGDLPGC